eukprot:m.351703 g.351703  ORF g.351703 m.351703 type:complete len:141 (+) comp27980_c7_seq1:524-946(+)
MTASTTHQSEYTGDRKGKFAKHGNGMLKYPDGSVYDGEFKDDEFNGMGTFKWPTTGESYVGWWRDGEMHGKGRFTFGSGGFYTGGFSHGKMHGVGKLTIKIFAEDGTETEVTKEGTWEAGVFTPPPDENVGKPKSAKKKK